MGILFNADEVFDMAIQIEENGAEFYRRAAANQSDSSNKDFFDRLAKMEDKHKKIFEQMRLTLTAKEKGGQVFDPEGMASQYLHSMADFHGGEGNPKAADSLTGTETLAEILNIAIDLEKKSILFYVDLKGFVSEELGKGRIDAIIAEEQKHVVQLTEVLQRSE